jgi:hypothetical protein
LNDDQKKKLDQLDQEQRPELHGNLKRGDTSEAAGATEFEEIAITYHSGRWRALGEWETGDVPSVPGIVPAFLRIKVDWSSSG